MAKIRVAVIGCGRWGSNYLRIFQAMEGAEVGVVCEEQSGPLEQVQKLYPHLATTTDFSTVLKEDQQIDAVVIATPAVTHCDLVKKVLQGGRAVLVEKPLALTVSDCEDLVKVAQKQKQILMVGHTFLYNPAVRKMKEYIAQGTLGEIYYLQAARTHLGPIRTDVSAFWDLAPHDVSIFNYLLGEQPHKVSAAGVSHLNAGRQDVAFMNLFYQNNVLGNIHISWVDSNKLRQVAAIGSKARILFDDLNLLERLRIFQKGVSIDKKPYSTFGEFQLLLRDGDIVSPKVDAQEPLRNVCLEFVHSIRTGEKPLSDGVNGLEVVRVMCAIQKSIEQEGTPVSISDR